MKLTKSPLGMLILAIPGVLFAGLVLARARRWRRAGRSHVDGLGSMSMQWRAEHRASSQW